MKKTLVLLLAFSLVSALFSALAPVSASALGLDPAEMPGESVYASQQEKETVLTTLSREALEKNSVVMQEDAISKLYYVDAIQYAKTGQLVFGEYLVGSQHDLPVYVANSYLSDGTFACVTFIVQANDGSNQYAASPMQVSLEWARRYLGVENPEGALSVSYADYAELIRERLGRDSFLPQSAVRFVVIKGESFGWRYAFYVNDGTAEGFFMIGHEYNPNYERFKAYPQMMPESGLSGFIDMEKFSAIANEIAAQEEKKNDDPSGGSFSANQADAIIGEYSGFDKIKRIENVQEYLAANTKQADETADPESSGPASVAFFNWQTGVALGAVAILVLAAILALSRTRKKED